MNELVPQPDQHPRLIHHPSRVDRYETIIYINDYKRHETWFPPYSAMIPELVDGRWVWVWVEGNQVNDAVS